MSDSPLLRASRELYVSILAGGAVDLDALSVERLGATLEEENITAGRQVFAEGEALDNVYFMRSGRVRLERVGAAPWTIDGSAAFGAFEAVLGRPHARSATALADVLMMRIPTESWLQLLDDDFDLARLVVVEGLRRLADLEVHAWPLRADLPGESRLRAVAVHEPLRFLDRVSFLASVPLLQAAGVQVLADVAAMVTECSLERGEPVHARGVPSERAFIVIDGEILGVHHTPDVTHAFGPGDLVCGASWLGEPQLAWESRATKHTRVLVLETEQWFDVMEEHAQLLRATLATIAQTRDAILEKLALQHGPLTVTSTGRASMEGCSR